MRFACAFAVVVGFTAAGARAQQLPQRPPSLQNQPTLTVQTTLVEVPVLVKSKDGQPVFALTAEDFILTDDGAPQAIRLEQDTDREPLALAIVVETGGAGAHHIADYAQLDAILDNLIGQVEHRVALIGFDSAPHLVVGFTHITENVSDALSHLNSGDNGAAILDAIAKALDELQAQPPRFRRAILLLSETRDQDSKTTLNEVLRRISDTNTTIYSFGFSSTAAAVEHEASKFNRPDEPGPAHGCFSRDSTDPVSTSEYQGHYGRQVLDCISDLAPPLRLATMAFLAANDGLRKNTASEIAQLTGGEFFHFHDARDLRAGLIRVSNDVPNHYVLSYRPTSVIPGMHVLHVEVRNQPHLALKARSEYWMDAPQP